MAEAATSGSPATTPVAEVAGDSKNSVGDSGEVVVEAAPLFKHNVEVLKIVNGARNHNDTDIIAPVDCIVLEFSIHFLCGNKSRYSKRTIDPNLINQPKIMLIPLVQAERAWSFAMELKESYRDSNEPERARFHATRRLKKATKFAEEFARLCSLRGDDRTALEAEAYSSALSGTFELENEQWQNAMQKLIHARQIYEQLGRVGDQEYKDICKRRVDELDPSITYCNYNLGSGKHGSGDIQALLELNKTKGPGADLLNAKLESMLAESRKKQATTLTEISWRGKVIAVKSEKLRVAFLSVQDVADELDREENFDAKIDLYDKLFITYNDAHRLLAEEVKSDGQQKSAKAEAYTQSLQHLQTYVTFLKYTRTVERGLKLVESLQKRLKGREELSEEEKKTTKYSRPEEIVRLYENLIQSTNDLEEVRPKDDVEQQKEIAANILTYKAFRCFYLAISYGDNGKTDEAIALLNRALRHTSTAVDHHKACAPPKKSELDKLESLTKKIKTEKCLVIARNHLSATTETLTETKPNHTLLSNIDNYDASFLTSKPTRVVDLPPDFEPIPCRPYIFDLAIMSLEYPSLEKRKGSGRLASLFGSFWKRS